jgi:protocatechuate 4,5-dioxygenase alpha chain
MRSSKFLKRNTRDWRTDTRDSSFIDRSSIYGSGDRFGMTLNHPIPGTIIFDGEYARKGYALNRMCFSFNEAANREAFVRDEDGYCARFSLTPDQRLAVKKRDVLAMLEAGGNIYYLAKLAGIFHMNVQDIGAQQTGLSLEAFKEKLQQH